MSEKEEVLFYSYHCLLGDFDYKTTIKGKTITVVGGSTKDKTFTFKTTLIDTGDSVTNVEKINGKLKPIVKKFQKKGSVNTIIKEGLVKEIYDEVDKKSKFINNYTKIGSSNFCFKKRNNLEFNPDKNEVNCYFVNGKTINKHKKVVKEFLKNLEDDKLTNLFENSSILVNSKYFVLEVKHEYEFNDFNKVIDVIDNGEHHKFEELNTRWKKYIENIVTKKHFNEIMESL